MRKGCDSEDNLSVVNAAHSLISNIWNFIVVTGGAEQSTYPSTHSSTASTAVRQRTVALYPTLLESSILPHPRRLATPPMFLYVRVHAYDERPTREWG